MADAIKGNITIESGSVDKAAASIEMLNASLKDSLKSAKALNAELTKTSAKSGGSKSGGSKSGTTKSGGSKSGGGSTAENSLKAANITKFQQAFGTALTNSIKIKNNIIEAGKITTQIKNEFSAMLKKVGTAHANVSANAAAGTGGANGATTMTTWGGGASSKQEQKQLDRLQMADVRHANKLAEEDKKLANQLALDESRRAAKKAEKEEKEKKANAKHERELAERNAQFERAAAERLATDNRRFAQKNAEIEAKHANKVKEEGIKQANRVINYNRRRDDILRDREERERRGSFRRSYYAERQFDMVRDQFIGHGFGTSFGVLKNAGGIGRQKFFDWFIKRQTKALGLNPQDPDYQLKRSAIMHDLVNKGGGIARVAGLIGGVGLTFAKVSLKLIVIITKALAKIHMIGAAIGALITAIGAATAAQEYDRYRGQMTKLMVSHDMFANDTILPFDEKAKQDYVNENYKLAHKLTSKNAMRGLDTVESGIRLAHLVGVGEGGGFKTDDEAMNFTRGLIAAAQVNGMTDAELQTLQYQGAQIASKGYAELLDIKPLMNSAPGIINDLIKFTGMSREELLKSGKTRELTWEKFKNMFVTNRGYYETLASRRDSQTISGQFQAAKQAFGLGVMGVSSGGIAEGGTKDIMQELAGSDLILMLGEMLGKIAGEFVKWFVMMFADEGDNSIRGAITNFGLTVVDFLGETAHVVVDLISNIRLIWHTWGETFKSIVRFLAGNALTRTILEDLFGGKLPKWALPDDEESNDKGTVWGLSENPLGGRTENVFGGNMETERLIDDVQKHLTAENKRRIANEIAYVAETQNKAQGLAAKGRLPQYLADFATEQAEAKIEALRQQPAEVDRDAARQVAWDELESMERERRESMGVKGGILRHYTDATSIWNGNERVVTDEGARMVRERMGITTSKNTINAQAKEQHEAIDEAVDETRQKIQTRDDLAHNRTTNKLLEQIEANTGKGKAALDKVTDVLIEFTKNRVINNITRVRPNVVVNFGDISDTSSINFAMSEMTSKLKHAIENVAGEDTVTLQIGGING